jgi:uncharacterized glyoxalase superfamily protein PhnB
MVKAVPDGYHTLTPYLIVPDGEAMLHFRHDVFSAELHERFNRPDGTLKHAELQIGDSRLMMAQGDQHYHPQTQTFYVYLNDVDATYHRALATGAKSLAPISDQFYGDRSGGFEDPAGNRWYVATHVEDLNPEEIQRRALAHESLQA